MYYTFSSLPFTFSHLGVKSGSDPTHPMSRLHAWQMGASGAISRDVVITSVEKRARIYNEQNHKQLRQKVHLPLQIKY